MEDIEKIIKEHKELYRTLKNKFVKVQKYDIAMCLRKIENDLNELELVIAEVQLKDTINT